MRQVTLEPITDIEAWMPWAEEHYPDFGRKGADLLTVLLAGQGNPMVISNLCEQIEKNLNNEDVPKKGDS